MKKEQSILGLIRENYIFTIIFPVVINFNYLISKTWSIDDDNSVFSQIFFYIAHFVFINTHIYFLHTFAYKLLVKKVYKKQYD